MGNTGETALYVDIEVGEESEVSVSGEETRDPRRDQERARFERDWESVGLTGVPFSPRTFRSGFVRVDGPSRWIRGAVEVSGTESGMVRGVLDDTSLEHDPLERMAAGRALCHISSSWAC
jgi:hypothetical protein